MDTILLNAVARLKVGGLIIFPTETVYGLGASIYSDAGITEIYRLKNRPQNKSLSVHIGLLDQVTEVAQNIPTLFYKLARKFMPGPLTVVLEKKAGVSPLISQDGTVAVRMPNHLLFSRLITLCGFPIVGTSANLSGDKPLWNAQDAQKLFPDFLTLDGGNCRFKEASTVISLLDSKVSILREGALSSEEIFSFLQK